MQKKNKLLFILFFICYCCSANDMNYFNELEGSWLSNNSLSFYDLDCIPKIYKFFYKEIIDETLVFQIDEYFHKPCFSFGTASHDIIFTIEKRDNGYVIISNLTYGKFNSDKSSIVPVISDEKVSMRIKFLDKDEIQILDCGFDEKIWYRIDGPARIDPRKAQCNDNRVRIRLKPNLNCQTLGYLNKNDKVVIKDRSEEKYEIDGEKWYWYKVDFPTLPDGWVYGKYLDIEK